MFSPDSLGVTSAPAYGSQVLRAKEQRTRHIPPCILDYDGLPFHDVRSGLWLYGNVNLLRGKLGCVKGAFGANHHTAAQLDAIETEAERLVLDSKVLVCGIHNVAHMRAAVVPLRWGSPRIVVMSGGFKFHLGEDLNEEPFRAARLWRYCWDPLTDLAVSRRGTDKSPTFATNNPTVDRMISLIVSGQWPGLPLEVPADQQEV